MKPLAIDVHAAVEFIAQHRRENFPRASDMYSEEVLADKMLASASASLLATLLQ